MTSPAPDGPVEAELARLAQARRDTEAVFRAAEAAEYAAIVTAATNPDPAARLTKYRIAQLTGRVQSGIAHIVRRHTTPTTDTPTPPA